MAVFISFCCCLNPKGSDKSPDKPKDRPGLPIWQYKFLSFKERSFYMTGRNAKVSVANAMAARQILKKYLTPTPLRRYPGLDRLTGAKVYIKHENQNPTGTFKIRGGINLMHHLAAHYTRNLVEGAGGSCLGAAVKIRERLKGKTVAIQMSGANASADELRKAVALPCLETGSIEA